MKDIAVGQLIEILKIETDEPCSNKDRLGERRMMSCNQAATIIAYRSSKDIDVKFDDGTIVTNKRYARFKEGYIKYSTPPVEEHKVTMAAENDAKTTESDSTETKTEVDPIDLLPGLTPDSSVFIDEDEDDKYSHFFVPEEGKPFFEMPTESDHLDVFLSSAIDEFFPEDKTLLFESRVDMLEGESTYYFVEKYKDKYFFEYGISILGADINRSETNRLNIIVATEYEYNSFKNWLFKKLHRYRAHIRHWSSVIYFNFVDEPDSNTEDINIVSYNARIHNLFGPFFSVPINKLILSGFFTEIHAFELNAKRHRVVHDIRYTERPYDGETEFQMIPDSIIANKFLEAVKTGDAGKDLQYHEAICRQQYDLMREALYIHKYKKYPRQMIVVNGWTAKDFLETQRCSFEDTYCIMMLLKHRPEEGKIQLIQLLRWEYPRLFNREVQYREHFQPTTKSQERAKINEETTSTNPLIANLFQKAHRDFLSTYTIPMIEDELKKYIIGQDELVKHTAVFLYYHVLRQIHTELSMRPLLIAGPSGSGKTEIWRAAKKAFDKFIRVEIIDGSTITQDGWSGQRKLSSVLQNLDTATILVIDEFDKLATPSYAKGGENVSQRIQAEFLKLLEGDFTTTGFRTDGDNIKINYNPDSLGIVLVGAFEKVRTQKEHKNDGVVGFLKKTNEEYEDIVSITDEDLIDFGVVPELVGRISDKCTTNKLDAQQYLQIIKNQHSKVSVLINELNELGVDTSKALTDDVIVDLANQSQTNSLGVRWVSAQIENLLLNLLLRADLRAQFAQQEEQKTTDEESAKKGQTLLDGTWDFF